jgi:hypothetical protein
MVLKSSDGLSQHNADYDGTSTDKVHYMKKFMPLAAADSRLYSRTQRLAYRRANETLSTWYASDMAEIVPWTMDKMTHRLPAARRSCRLWCRA